MCDKSDYFNTLPTDVKNRYLDKIKLVNNVDPYLVSIGTCSTNINDFPRVTYFDIVNYLVFNKSAYTQDEFKAYKSLEAYNLFHSKWIKTLCVKKITNSDNVLLLSEVIHSQRLNLPPVSLWCVVKNNGEVLTAHCTCTAGLGECCSHVGAALFAVEAAVRDTEPISVTGEKAYWMVPNTNLGVPSSVEEVDYSVHKHENSSTSSNSDVDEIGDLEKATFLEKLSALKNTPVILKVTSPYCFTLQQENQEATYQRGILNNLYDQKHETKTLNELIEVGKTIDFHLTSDECAIIQEKTMGQAGNKNWFCFREGRITASLFKACCRTKLTKPAISTIKAICYKKPFFSKQTTYGCLHEKDAIEAYKAFMLPKHENFVIKTSGLIINSMFPCFGASPDGLVNCDCCGSGCLEIKCPYCVRDSNVEELVHFKNMCLKANVLEDNIWSIDLDQNHSYFHQVQMQMAVAERSYCDLVVWSKKNFYLERVYSDKTFWECESEKALAFFNNVIMPELLGKYFTRLLPLKQISTNVQDNVPTSKHKVGQHDMICCANKYCSVQWYSLKDLKKKSVPKGVWYCKKCATLKFRK
ncbi:uncharacterized protein LOC116164293 [Photinus pyralis]|uniref:uncharacterized protein LOC116164293 n=1 Tax=Photinus pyralis TaxID=7054 RepID=UPI0012672BED|nr:uncharacterized protein LOC116164293 [Photinus pyralis]